MSDNPVSAWQPIETAPHSEGVEILVRDEIGALSLVAWSNDVTKWSHAGQHFDAGWYRRAGGGWDLFDGFAPQQVYPIAWMVIPQEDA